MSLENLSDWLAATRGSEVLASLPGAVPTIQSVHILAIAVILSANMLLHARLAGLVRVYEAQPSWVPRFLPWILASFAVLVASGVLLVLIEPHRQLLNGYFQLKMWLVVALVALSVALIQLIRHASLASLGPSARLATRAGGMTAIALLLWIIWCGRWIAYTQ
jgi:hypothetical protein